MRTRLTPSGLVLSVLLLVASAYSQDANTPFDPVPVGQRNDLAIRLTDYTDAFRRKDWGSLYDLAAAVNKRLRDGSRMSKETFARQMNAGFDSYRLLKFMPIRTKLNAAGQFDVYGCGEFPSGDKKTERIAVAVRAVRENDVWCFTAWDYFDPRQPCSNLSDPAWKPSPYLRLDYLPELVCDLNTCVL